MVPGAFVRVLFPTEEAPGSPGLPHIGYILQATPQVALVAYTTSQTLPAGAPVPVGARVFTVTEAARLNQSKAFVLRLDILARLPVSAGWFPNLHMPAQGVIALAPARLREEIKEQATNLLHRHRALIQVRGS